MRRVITDTFDAYFHLWHNGTPNWEKEKRAWELEQEKEWTKVLSKSAKRALKKTEPPLKRVRFAEKLVQSPKKVVPSSSFDLAFGSHVVQVDPSQINAHPTGAPPILPFFEVHSVFFTFRMNTHVAISLENAIPVIGLSLCRAFRGRDLGTLRI